MERDIDQLFEKLKDLLINESKEDCLMVMCGYLALRYMVHSDEYTSLEEYINEVSKDIKTQYLSNSKNILSSLL
jgi:hypothetical protein